MLSEISTILGVNLAQSLKGDNIQLVPKRGTLLAELCSSIIVNGAISHTDSLAGQIRIGSEGSTSPNSTKSRSSGYNASVHDTLSDEYAVELSKLIASYSSYARTVVNPEVNIFKDKLLSALQAHKAPSIEDSIKVNYYTLDNIYNSDFLDEELKTYHDKNVTVSASSMPHAKLKFELLEETFNYTDYILTGESDVDALILSWLKVNDINLGSYITTIEVDNRYVYNDRISGTNYALAQYLFYRALSIKADLNLGFSVSTLTTTAADFRDYWGTVLYGVLRLLKDSIKAAYLFSSTTELSVSIYNFKGVELSMYEDSFKKLGEAGGSIDTVLGYIVSNDYKAIVRVDEIIPYIEKYNRSWSNARSLYAISVSDDKLVTFRYLAANVFHNCYNKDSLTESELDVVQATPNYILTTYEKVDKYLEKLYGSDLEDLDKICLEIVAGIRYRYTDALYILKTMYSLMSEDDKICPMQAALYASVDYMVEFFIKQMDVVRIS